MAPLKIPVLSLLLLLLWCVRWLRWLTADLPGPLLLIPGGAPAMNKVLQELTFDLGIVELRLTMGCLRSGGATEFMDRNGNLQLLAHLGRWRSAYSLEHYLQETIAFLVNVSISEESEQRGGGPPSSSSSPARMPPGWTLVAHNCMSADTHA